jgi:uncharacterized protein (TIGR02594 family)
MTTTPKWLQVMRTLTGTTETPGSASNPVIMNMVDTVAKAYSEMADYCKGYTDDSVPWCGLCVAYCMTKAGIRPVFGPTDTDRWMWAQAWDRSDFGITIAQPRHGCVVVMEREGGGHVCLFEHMDGDELVCRGGNQSDQVKLSNYDLDTVISFVWPNHGGPMPPPERRELEAGDEGKDVEALQKSLGVPVDGEFGAITEAAVQSFQAATGLDDDGVVGPKTWEQLDILDKKMRDGDNGLGPVLQEKIIDVVERSHLDDYEWEDRGEAPLGYLEGMALTYALAVKQWHSNSDLAKELAKAAGDPDDDALAFYDSAFDDVGMHNDKAGLDTLRHLWVMLVGLGMCESSGQYYCGRDMNADNTSSTTCEAGLFQTSWNIKDCSPQFMAELLDTYVRDPNGWLPVFSQGLYPDADDLSSYGSGEGATYQWLAKYSPAFAVFTTALGLRKRRSHWGPIGRFEVELVKDVDTMLQDVQRLAEV